MINALNQADEKLDYSEEDIKTAIEIMKNNYASPIIGHHNGFIIMAQSESDYKAKERRISEGDTNGFFRVIDALLKTKFSLKP